MLVAAAVLAACCAMSSGDSMPSFDGATTWLGSPIQAGDTAGKVVLVDFWDYTCLNCLRTLPYLREWYKRYHDDNFIIIGVHSNAYSFSGEEKNITAAMSRLGVTWPVANDNHGTLWKRWGAKAWPTEFLFDQQGRLVDTNVGEGNYQHTESEIQQLIHRVKPGATLPPLMALLPQDSYAKPGAICYPQTAEVVMQNTEVADAPPSGDPSQNLEYNDRGGHKDGSVYLNGFWHATREAIVAENGRTSFTLPYHAIEVSTVMRPDGGSTRVSVAQDGKPVAHEDAGRDIQYDASGNSYVTVDVGRSYQLLMNKKFGQHELVLQPSGGVGIYEIAFESCEVPAGTR